MNDVDSVEPLNGDGIDVLDSDLYDHIYININNKPIRYSFYALFLPQIKILYVTISNRYIKHINLYFKIIFKI